MVEDVTAGIRGADVETDAGTTKSGLRWVVEVVTGEVTDENQRQRLPEQSIELARRQRGTRNAPKRACLWQACDKTSCRRRRQI